MIEHHHFLDKESKNELKYGVNMIVKDDVF